MASKRSKRPIHKLPHEPAITQEKRVIEDAVADAYGFRVIETWELLRAARNDLKKAPKTGDNIKINVLDALSFQADTALEISAPLTIGNERWALAIEAGVDAMGELQRSWVIPAKVRIRELYIDANHSTPSLRERLHRTTDQIQSIIDRCEQIRSDIEALRREPPPPRGQRLARWQAILREAGFPWSDVARLFVYAPNQNDSAEAARKRVARLLADEQERHRHDSWFKDLKSERADS